MGRKPEGRDVYKDLGKRSIGGEFVDSRLEKLCISLSVHFD